jgi:type VI secretion system protein ImpE
MKVARDHFEAGRLGAAIEAMNAEVKAHPLDADRRGFLGELLCFTGDLERADRQYDTLVQQDGGLAIGVALLRQLIRAEQARRQFFGEGRLPEMLGVPPEHLKIILEASIRLREGDAPAAMSLLARAEELRPALAGQCDGASFDDFRDLDDLTASFFEVMTSTGKYYAVAMEQVDSIEFRRPERPRDLIWRRAEMVVRDGPEGEIFLPAVYAPLAGAAAAEIDDAARLGRTTEWAGGDGTPVRGIGQRCFLVGEESRGMLQLGRIEFASAR